MKKELIIYSTIAFTGIGYGTYSYLSNKNPILSSKNEKESTHSAFLANDEVTKTIKNKSISREIASSKNNNDDNLKSKDFVPDRYMIPTEKLTKEEIKKIYNDTNNYNFSLNLNDQSNPENFFKRARGAEAIKLIGNDLAAVAKLNNMTSAQLLNILKTDSTVWVHGNGMLSVEEVDNSAYLLTKEATETVTTSNSSVLSNAVITNPTQYAELKLHSRATAKKLIYLNFIGKAVNGNIYSSAGYTTIPAFTLDSDGTTFSSTELALIKDIHRRIAEDYAAFDVDVTTEVPTDDALFRTSKNDEYYGHSVIFTNSTKYICSQSCGGISYIGVFKSNNTSTSYQKMYDATFVFNDKTANNAKYMADAASHEMGHAIGLQHWGTSTSGYTYGQGSGTTGVCAIMGAAYYQNLAHWSKGEYYDAKNSSTSQDDLAVISSIIPYSANPSAQTLSTAKSATLSDGTISQTGLITKASATDYFKFTVSANKNVTFKILNTSFRNKLNLKLSLYDANGVLVKTISPDSGALDISSSLDLSAGNYFAKIETQALGDYKSTGFTKYGQLGHYTFSSTSL